MGVYTPQEFVGKLGELIAAEGQVPRTVIEKGSLLAKRNILSRTPSRLSGVGRRGAKLGVQYKTGPWGGDGWQSVVFATGPFQLIERDTRPHVEPKQGRRGKGGHYVVISNASEGEGVHSVVHHPGTKGKHPFEYGVAASLPLIEKMFQAGSYEAARSTFL